jgi:hypothetical protein
MRIRLPSERKVVLRLPNAESAIIDPEKLHSYLLSPVHPVGRFKAVFFRSLGYTQDDWRRLEADIRRQHLTKDAVLQKETPYGRKYELRGEIRGPTGKHRDIVSVWIVLAGEEVPRFVTAYPGDRR